MMLYDLLQPVALVASLYSCGGAVVRLRYSRHLMSPAWIALYFSILALCAFAAATFVTPGIPVDHPHVQVVYMLHALTSIACGCYIRMTRSRWGETPPPVACSEWADLTRGER